MCGVSGWVLLWAGRAGGGVSGALSFLGALRVSSLPGPVPSTCLIPLPSLPGDQKQASRQHCIQDLNLQAVQTSTFSTREHGKNTFLYQGQVPRPSTAPTPSPFCSAVGYSSTEACRAPFTGYKTTCTIWRPVRHSFTILFVIQIIASPVQFGANLQASSMEETYMGQFLQDGENVCFTSVFFKK